MNQSRAALLRERLARLDRSNRDAAVKIAALRAETARLAALVADARKSTGKTIPPRAAVAAGRNTADGITLAHPRIVIGPMGIYEENF